MRPFLRWAGGKRWLASSLPISVPETSRYIEPFLGGGAIFFSQTPQESTLSDLNAFLINTYRWMRDSPEQLFKEVTSHFADHSPTYYYVVRKSLDSKSISDAASFLYLNRSCFNGIFRVNLSGRFNVPVGTKAYPLVDEKEFIKWSERLNKSTITVSDFEPIIDASGEGDFLFIDPPYTVKHNNNGFIEYNEKIFSWSDQVRLAKCLTRAKSRGADFLLTNADHDTVRELYLDNYELFSRQRGSEMASRAAHRGKTTELLVASSRRILKAPDLL